MSMSPKQRRDRDEDGVGSNTRLCDLTLLLPDVNLRSNVRRDMLPMLSVRSRTRSLKVILEKAEYYYIWQDLSLGFSNKKEQVGIFFLFVNLISCFNQLLRRTNGV